MALAVFVHSNRVRRFALQRLQQALLRQGVELGARDLHYNLLLGTVSLDAFEIRSSGAQTVATAESVSARIGLRQLFHGEYRFDDVVVKNPRLHLVIGEHGRNNLSDLFHARPGFSAASLVAVGGSLRVEDRASRLSMDLPSWRLALDRAGAQLRLQQRGTLLYEGRELPIDALEASAAFKDGSVELKSLRLGSGQSHLDASGSYRNSTVQLAANATLALSPVARFAGWNQEISGNLGVTLKAFGAPDHLAIEALLAGSPLRYRQFDGLQLDASAAYQSGAQRIRVTSFSLRSPLGAVTGDGWMAFKAPEESAATLKVERFDLRPYAIASTAAGTVEARWPGLEYEQAEGDARIRLTPQRATSEKQLPVAASMTAAAHGSWIVASIDSMEAAGAHLEGQVQIEKRSTVDGQLMAECADAGSTARAVAAVLRRAPPKWQASGPVRAFAEIGGSLQRPWVKAFLRSPGLDIGPLADLSFDLDASYARDRVTITDANVRWRDQQLRASGSIGLEAARPLKLDLQMDSVSATEVLAGLGRRDIPVDGTVSLRMNATGTLDHPRIAMSAFGTGLTAYGEPLGQLSMAAQLRDNLLELTQLRLDKPGNGYLEAAGSFDLDASRYSVSAEGRGLQIRQLMLPGFRHPVRGVIDLNANGAGTTDAPGLDADLSAAGLDVGGVVVGSVHTEAHAAGQQVRVSAELPDHSLTFAAHGSFLQPYPVDFEVTANSTDLARLPLAVSRKLAGTITASIRGSGNLEHWKDVQAHARLERLKIQLAGETIRTETPLIAAFANRTFSLQPVTLLSGGSTVRIAGSLPLERTSRPGAIGIQGTLDLGGLAAFVVRGPAAQAEGQVALDAMLRGTLRQIHTTGTIQLTNGSFRQLTDINLSGRLANGELTIAQASGRWAKAALTATGRIPLGLLPFPAFIPVQHGPAELALDLRALDPSAIGGFPPDAGGRISCHLDAGLPRLDLSTLTAELTFSELRLKIAGIPLEQQGISAVSVQNGLARVEPFRLAGPATALELSGTAGLGGAGPLALNLDAAMDASIPSAFASGLQAHGRTVMRLRLTGTAQDPQAAGFLQMNSATFSLPDMGVVAENLDARLDLAANRLQVTSLKGILNGGTVALAGGLEFGERTIRGADLKMTARNVYLDYPEGMKTISDADLRLQSSQQELVLGGGVTILEGAYTRPIEIGQFLMRQSPSRSGEASAAGQRNAVLGRMRFDVTAETKAPILVNNNLGRVALNANVRLVGTPYQPGMLGRMQIDEGGRITLRERSYTVDRGVVTFTSETRVTPSLDLLARTRAADYDVTLQMAGAPGRPTATLSSDPPLPGPELLALLVTGRNLEEARGAGLEIAGQRVLPYLAGIEGTELSDRIERAPGLTKVRLEPNLISPEADPSSRFTTAQDITRRLGLTYSMNLADGGDQIRIARFNLSRPFTARAVQQSDNTYRFEFLHGLRFGARAFEPPVPPDFHEREVGSVAFTGATVFTRGQLADRFKIKPGSRYDFFKIQKGVDRLERFYAGRDMLSARLRLERQSTDGSVNLKIAIDPGPQIQFAFDGWDVPREWKDKVRTIWREGLSDVGRADDAVRAIRGQLQEQGYAQAMVDCKVTAEDNRKRVQFRIQPGMRYRNVKLVFQDARAFDSAVLRQVLKKEKLLDSFQTEPERVRDALARFYRERGYLDAAIDSPRLELNAAALTERVIVPVQEGGRYRVNEIEFTGNTVFRGSLLEYSVPVQQGQPYEPDRDQRSVRTIEELYRNRGWNDVEVRSRIRKRSSEALVDVVFEITENKQHVVQDVVVEGADRTGANLIRSELPLVPGDPLTGSLMGRSRRSLYGTGAFERIDISPEEMTGGEVQPWQVPVRLRVKVRELQSYQFLYGGFFDTDRGPGAIADFSVHNSLGSARILGLRARYDSQIHEARLYFSQPLLRNLPLQTDAVGYVRREVRDAFVTDRRGFTSELRKRAGNGIFTWGYRLEQVRTYERDAVPMAPSNVNMRVAPLTASFSRDTRDDVLDATRGSFLSQAAELGTKVSGSELQYGRYFGQFFKYVPLGNADGIPGQNGRRKVRFLYAGAVRIGFAGGLGRQELIPSERFFAGGGTTLRGFAQDRVGPVDAAGRPVGGNAIFLISNELRHPLGSIFDIVGFSDIGNVYRHASDFDPVNVRETAGLGLRARTPYFLLRLDYGVKLDRRPGEGIGRLFFSIGQAF